MFAISASLILSMIGFLGTLKINQCMMLIHSFFYCSIMGAFYVFLLIDCFLREEQHGPGAVTDGVVGDRTVLFFLSLPFLAMFLIGCHSMYLLNLIMDEVKSRKQERILRGGSHVEMSELSTHENQEIPQILSAGGGIYIENDIIYHRPPLNDEYLVLQLPADAHTHNLCVICMEKERDSIFYPCGHECVCSTCGKEFMYKAVQKICPVCRNRIKDIVRVYR